MSVKIHRLTVRPEVILNPDGAERRVVLAALDGGYALVDCIYRDKRRCRVGVDVDIRVNLVDKRRKNLVEIRGRQVEKRGTLDERRLLGEKRLNRLVAAIYVDTLELAAQLKRSELVLNQRLVAEELRILAGKPLVVELYRHNRYYLHYCSRLCPFHKHKERIPHLSGFGNSFVEESPTIKF